MARLLQALRKVTGNQKTTFNNKGMQKNTSENKIVNSSRWYHSSQQRSGNCLKFAWAHQNCTTEVWKVFPGLMSLDFCWFVGLEPDKQPGSMDLSCLLSVVCVCGGVTVWRYIFSGPLGPIVHHWCHIPYLNIIYHVHGVPVLSCHKGQQTGFLNMNLNKFTLLKFPQQSSQLNAWEHLW